MLLIAGFGNYTRAQVKVNVIEKTVKKEFDYTGEKIIILGEKSDISIQKWEGKKVKVQISLIAKNPSKTRAEKDIDILQYSVSQTADAIKLSNFFRSDRIVDVSSNLSVEYFIYVPSACNVEIKNLYGKTDIANVSISGKIDNSFGSVSLRNISGKLDVDLYYSNLSGTGTRGELNIGAKNSDLFMKDLAGKNTINTTYGEINIEPSKDLKALDILSQRSSVIIVTDNFGYYNYELDAYKDQIILPAKYSPSVTKESGGSLFRQSSHTNNASVKIKTTYCPITIKSN